MTAPDGLWVTEQGAAGDPVVVLVHGTMDRATSFAKTAARLDGFRVVRYDRRGYGRSVALGPGSIADHARDLVALIGGRRVVVVGHSLGGLVALAAACSPSVGAAGTWEAPLSWAPWWPDSSAGAVALGHDDPADVAETFMRRMIGDARWERLPAATRQARRQEGAALTAELRSAREGPPFDPDAITCPVRVGYGCETTDRHRRAARELAALLAAPAPTTIAGATHGAHRSHPGEFAAFVREVASAV